jgi:hypothetical protein
MHFHLQRSTADIGMMVPSPFPTQYYVEYLNSRPVQEALGVPRNFTTENMNVNFGATGYDDVLGGPLENMGYLVDQGISVALIYGDRDYSNNCTSIYYQSWYLESDKDRARRRGT